MSDRPFEAYEYIADVSPEQPRHDPSERLLGVLGTLSERMGELPAERLAWLRQQSATNLTSLVIDINASVLNVDASTHHFDSQGLTTSPFLFVQPPHHDDKQELFEYTYSKNLQLLVSDSENAETTLRIAAMALPTSLESLELFGRANESTCRALRMVLLSENIKIQDIKKLVAAREDAKGYCYSTTAADYVLRSVHHYLKSQSGMVEPRDSVLGRRIHARTLIGGLFGSPDVPLISPLDTASATESKINLGLRNRGWTTYDPAKITTVQNFQLSIATAIAPKTERFIRGE